MSKNVIIVGAAGRMGLTFIRCLAEKRVPGLELAGAVDVPGCPGQGEDIGPAAGVPETGIALTSDLAGIVADADVAIDFSMPAGTADIVNTMAEAGKAYVIGTTGLDAFRGAAFVKHRFHCIKIGI